MGSHLSQEIITTSKFSAFPTTTFSEKIIDNTR
jgi:hypothetical protein